MAQRNEQVQRRVREALEENPEISTSDLFDLARKIDPGIGEQNLRQFNARYVLPFKRRRRAEAPRGGGGRKSAGRPRGGEATPKRQPGRRRAAAQPEGGNVQAGGSGATGGEGGSQAGDRDAVRAVFLRFARDLSKAESRSALVDVMSNLDQYVDELLRLRR